VGDHRAVAAGSTEHRPAAAMADARGDECDLLRAALGLPLADGASQFRAALDGVPLVLRLPDDRVFEVINH
jgi:hypothetical protein